MIMSTSTDISEIADGIYRLSTFVLDIAPPAGFTFNQFLVLGDESAWSEILDTKDRATWVARLCTILYFAFFFLMPWYTARDAVKPVPERVTV